MSDYIAFLNVAKDEIETLIQYSDLIENSKDKETIKSILDEIMGDEFNHALISLLMAAKLMGIKIATDDITPDPNQITVS